MGDNNNYQCGIYEKNNNEGDRKFIKILTKCSEISQLNFKTVFANQDFSAAISVDNKLYIWGYLNKADYREVRKPSLVKNNIKSQIVFDKIYIGNKLFAIVNLFENQNYIKKILSLDKIEDNYYDNSNYSFILNEVKILNENENNYRNIPIKLCIGKNKIYVLCVDENKLLKEINENKKSEKGRISMNIKLEKNNKEEIITDLEKIYNSDRFVITSRNNLRSKFWSKIPILH